MSKFSSELSKRISEFLPEFRTRIAPYIEGMALGFCGNDSLIEGTDFTKADYPHGVWLLGGGFGIDGQPESITKAQTKVEAIFGKFREEIERLMDEAGLGFYVEGEPCVTITGEAGKADSIRNNVVWLKNKHYPKIKAAVIENNYDSEGNVIGLNPSAFASASNLHSEIATIFLEPSVANIFDSWIRLEDKSLQVDGEDVIPETEVNDKKREMNASVGLVVGWQHDYFRSQDSRFGSTFGFEAFGEVSAGSTLFQPAQAASQDRFDAGGQTWVYSQRMPTLRNELNITQRWAVGLTAFGGLALRNGWSLYLPVTWKIGAFDITYTPDPKHKEYTEVPKILSRDKDDVSLATLKDVPSMADPKLPGQKFRRWKNMWETGIGVRLAVSSRLTLGMRWTTGIPTKIEFETKPFDTRALHDLDRLGTKQSLTVQPMTISLEFLWNLKPRHVKSS